MLADQPVATPWYTNNHMEQRNYPRFAQPLVILMLAIVITAIVIIGKSFLVPVVLAIIFAMLLTPFAKLLERMGAHRKVATLIAIVVFILIGIGILSGLSLLIRSFVISIPTLHDDIARNIQIISPIIEKLGIGSIGTPSAIKDWVFSLIQGSTQLFGNLVSGTTHAVTQMTLTIIYTFFILSYRDKLKLFIYKLTPESRHENYKPIADNMMRVVPQYLIGLLLSAIILAVINSAAFMAIGVHQAVFLGTLVAVLNVIPYVGPLVGFLFVIAFTLLTQSPIHALMVAAVFLLVQFFDNNILTPSVTASRIRLNGLTAIMGIVLGGMIWGVAGMILALPVLGMIKIIAQYTDHLKPYAYLMGTEDTDEEEASTPKRSFIQRLFKK